MSTKRDYLKILPKTLEIKSREDAIAAVFYLQAQFDIMDIVREYIESVVPSND